MAALPLEDDSGHSNVVVWPMLFERRRRVVLGSSMMAINGRIQRGGESCTSSPNSLLICRVKAMPFVVDRFQVHGGQLIANAFKES